MSKGEINRLVLLTGDSLGFEEPRNINANSIGHVVQQTHEDSLLLSFSKFAVKEYQKQQFTAPWKGVLTNKLDEWKYVLCRGNATVFG